MKKIKKEVNMHIFLACAYNYQDFAQTQENLARSHDRETVTLETLLLNKLYSPTLLADEVNDQHLQNIVLAASAGIVP